MRESKFKNSDIGLIPEDWDCVKISTIAKGVFAGKNVKRTPFGRFPVFGSTGMIAFSNEYAFDFPSILIARVGANAGTINKVDGYYDVTDNTLIIRLKEDALRDYLYYQLITKNLNALKSGSGQPLITGTQIKNVDVLLPTNNEKFCETNRIVAALSDIDALISISKKLIEKKKNVKQGAMQELLSGKRRLPGFSEIWKCDSLNLHFNSGSTKGAVVKWKASSIPLPGLYKAFSASGQDVWVDYKMYDCDAIIISAVGEHCGKCFLAQDEWSVVANTHILLGDKKQYMPFWIHIFNNEAFWQRGGSGQPFVQVRETLKRIMPIPSLEEQKAIATILADMDSEILSLENRLTKYQSLKQGMMQQLLTGKIRLI